jgi:hypothetical protein
VSIVADTKSKLWRVTAAHSAPFSGVGGLSGLSDGQPTTTAVRRHPSPGLTACHRRRAAQPRDSLYARYLRMFYVLHHACAGLA